MPYNLRAYEYLVTADGESELLSVEAHSAIQALFVAGIKWGRDNPDSNPDATEFRILRR